MLSQLENSVIAKLRLKRNSQLPPNIDFLKYFESQDLEQLESKLNDSSVALSLNPSPTTINIEKMTLSKSKNCLQILM